MQAINPAKEGQIVPGTERLVEGYLLRNEPDQRFNTIRLLPKVIIADPYFSVVRNQERCQKRDGRSFSCSIRTKQSKDLAVLNGKTDTIHCHPVTKPLDHVFELYDRG